MTVANFGEQPPTSIAGRSLDVGDIEGASLDLLIDVPSYRIERLRATKPLRWNVDSGSMEVISVIDGTAKLGWEGGDFDLAAGQTAIVPAALEWVELRPVDGAVDAVISGVGGGRLVRRPG